ncbi:MAG: GldG family protein [Proteobacteria bacterium]|nr:GldG family protein [Pseudomonadota bacterium]
MKITANSRSQSRINSIVMLLLILCLTGLLAWLSVRYQTQMDWTQNGRHTLSHASLEVLNHIDGPVDITAYARENASLRQAVEKIVGRYQRLKPDIKLHFVNPDTVPDEVRSAGISVNGEMLLRYQGRTEHVKTGTEEEFTNALQRLARGSEHWLAFVEGHGERNPFGKANHDLSIWTTQLESRGFKIQPLNLAEVQLIPSNTKVLVIASPTIDLLPGEIAIIVEYLLRGGNILWLADPGSLHGLESLADQLSIEFPSGVVIDFAGSLIGIDDPTIVLNTPRLYPDHAVTRDFNYTTFFPTTASINVKDGAQWNTSSLLISADHTWLETGVLEGEVEYNKDSDLIGPLEIGISLERELERAIESESGEASATVQQRIIVIGDGDFLSNTYVGNSGNLDLGIRLINWLSNDDDFISIPIKTVNDAHLELSLLASGIIAFGFILVLPLLFLGTGLTVWWRRKKQ